MSSPKEARWDSVWASVETLPATDSLPAMVEVRIEVLTTDERRYTVRQGLDRARVDRAAFDLVNRTLDFAVKDLSTALARDGKVAV